MVNIIARTKIKYRKKVYITLWSFDHVRNVQGILNMTLIELLKRSVNRVDYDYCINITKKINWLPFLLAWSEMFLIFSSLFFPLTKRPFSFIHHVSSIVFFLSLLLISTFLFKCITKHLKLRMKLEIRFIPHIQITMANIE